jgi:hypothetical protein
MTVEDQPNNVHAFERAAIGKAVDEATKANEQPAPAAQFELSLEGRANLLTSLTGQALQGMMASGDYPASTFGPMAATTAVRVAKLTLFAIEREVGDMFKASQGQARG